MPGVDAIPGKGSRVPLYVLGSSMFGATLAAALGLPYAFASHFAPQLLEPAVAAYRQEFRPSEQLDRPYVIAGVNVFDADHFKAVHGLKRTPRLQLRRGDHGELTVESVFETRRPNPWQEDVDTLGESVESRFCARVFSPTLVATELGPRDRSHVVFTAATPTPDGASVIRLSLAVRSDDGAGPSDETIMSLLQGSRRAFDQDIGVWEHLVTDAPPRYAPSDRPVIEYRAFCEEFRDRDH